jgi:hypothetical protein
VQYSNAILTLVVTASLSLDACTKELYVPRNCRGEEVRTVFGHYVYKLVCVTVSKLMPLKERMKLSYAVMFRIVALINISRSIRSLVIVTIIVHFELAVLLSWSR